MNDGSPLPMIANRRFDPVWTAPLLYVVLGLIFTITPFVNSIRKSPGESNKDYSLWFEVGRRAASGETLYFPAGNGEVQFIYPPTLALFCFAPLFQLGYPAFVLLMGVGCAVSYAACVILSTILATGRWGGHPRWYYLLPGMAIGPYVSDLCLLGQVNLLLLLLVLGGILALRHSRPWLAGTLLAIAITIKVFPVCVIFYYLARKQFVAVGATVLAVVIIWFAIPSVLRGTERNLAELTQWSRQMIGDQSGNAMAARSSTGFTRRNQSIIAVVHRWLRPVQAGDLENQQLWINIADVQPQTAQRIGYAICLGLALVLVIVTSGKFGGSREAEAIETGMVTTLTVLCSPLAWTYFYCWLLPAWTAVLIPFLTRELGNTTPTKVRRTTLVGIVISAILLASALSEQFNPRLQAYGVTAAGGVVLYMTLAYQRWMLAPINSVSTSSSIRNSP